MADENTQVAPVAGAEENATQENKGFTYYFSDPDSVNAEMHHVVITLPYELPELPWHWHIEKPDDSLKDPVWDLKVNGWVENSKDGQAAILQEATQKIEELDKKSAELDKKNAALDQANDKFDQAMKAMQQSQQVQTQQSLALTQGLQKVAEGQEQANKVMASMQQILVGMQADQAKTATPTSDTKPAENTNKQENGGN
ncbi:hypothetical protein L2784_05885 [Lactobacillus crispatus]|jgi:hypothetical protein|uniref:Uncharacterized protein n=3 Tax=Lactobacillus crispatus TaxID=47770 RepID=K1M1Q2_9LACO|nr:hypothetical protein [Lactobacillus crispatus]QRD99618.1 hypothetical protein [Lactobacillus phage vB_Lcr_AB1]DAO82338.1 MAG TPA: hypothetical protein [Bacteriophage sp.]DAX87146.1 MAG TPA: hypothetical protein [Caudoviricetes sp.]EFE00195.1 hypothetical protein HMPREF0891_0009 [Lactobacillus crispatus 214-1]EKB63055.1 hypothetical protein HMPREF9249_02088 [Lactobacillus crispatus FB077-07]